MKIGLVCPYNIFKGGGVQECVLALQAELQRRGHTAKIITPLPRGYVGDEPEDVIFMGGSTDMKSPLSTTVQVSASGNSERISQVLEAEQFDVINYHEPWVPIISRQILAKSNALNIGTFHAKLPETRMSKTLERVITPYTKSILKSLDCLTAVSDSAADYVRHLTTAHVTIVPNGIDLSTYKPDTANKVHTPTILYVGRLEKRKGVKYLIKAFAELQKRLPEAQLIIAGDGPSREKLEEYCADLGLSSVEFLGYIDNDEKLRLMQTSTVFCSPALYGESFGIVLLEAMACQTPVVAGDNPGYMGVLSGTGAISIVNPKHAVDFSRRLEALLSSEALRKTWNEWAISEIPKYDYATVVDQYEAVYSDLCAKRQIDHDATA